ncbi:hypothetical protein [Schlesneria paludicola]|uniref:hypothetical protein n=1 Tax=Schlesneria paludicola TaxID=360056 RepID=UPI0012FB6AFA|nr:hypothetical protein [Schlesneria paludicola]
MNRDLRLLLAWLTVVLGTRPLIAAELDALDPAYHHTGELAGSLRTADPLPLYDADPQHVWNRLFAAISIRHSLLPSKRGGTPIARIEGGDSIDFLAWPGTTYWDEPETVARLVGLLDQFQQERAERMTTDPIRRVMLQRDLWAVFDSLVSQNISRRGDVETRQRRARLCGRLAKVIQSLALPVETLAQLPNNYQLALESGHFTDTHQFDPQREYLPSRLLTEDDEWQELDFYQPKVTQDIERRFVFLHTRAFRGRSYFRVFYRFPGGRSQLEKYLQEVEATGIDWKASGQHGSIMLKPDAPQVPEGTEVALLQFLIALDPNMKPVPTPLVESVRVNMFKTVDGGRDPSTNTGLGFNATKYTLKRRLAFAGMKHGGLQREPDDLPVYRIIFESENAIDWGPRGRFFELAAECRSCHSGSGRSGVFAIPSLINSGGIDSGAQLGVVHPLAVGQPSPHPARTVKWKTADETYRRLVEFVEN